MSIRTKIARWLSPELARSADRYFFLRTQVDDSHQWLSAYPDVRDTLQRLLELDRDHWRRLDEPASGTLPSEIWRFREILVARHAEQWEQNRKIRDIAYHLGDNCMPGNIDLLEQVADLVDCQPGCDNGYTESDTNAFVCRQMEEGTCGSAMAEELRALAVAFRNRQALAPSPAPEASNS